MGSLTKLVARKYLDLDCEVVVVIIYLTLTTNLFCIMVLYFHVLMSNPTALSVVEDDSVLLSNTILVHIVVPLNWLAKIINFRPAECEFDCSPTYTATSLRNVCSVISNKAAARA